VNFGPSRYSSRPILRSPIKSSSRLYTVRDLDRARSFRGS
jgi:hypothetical protein